MSSGDRVIRELSLGEIISKTFQLYRNNFSKIILFFVIVETIIGLISFIIQRIFVLPAAPTAPATQQQLLNWLGRYFEALIPQLTATGIVTLVVSSIATGVAVRLSSEQIENRKAELGPSIRFAFSKLVSLIFVTILVGILVFLGFIALIIPGIILAMMFALAIPVVIIEPSSVFKSLGRSRVLVGRRWLKTFALYLVFGIIYLIGALILRPIGTLFDGAIILTSVLSALYVPLLPIGLTVYYYSNMARLAPASTSPPFPNTSSTMTVKYCPSCGTGIPNETNYCPSCGIKLPT
jgi:hypothetical protein